MCICNFLIIKMLNTTVSKIISGGMPMETFGGAWNILDIWGPGAAVLCEPLAPR